MIKVEDPGRGDYTRDIGFAGESQGAFYARLNRNKRSLRLDLAADAGREVFLDLVERADAVVEGFRPGVVTRLGIDYPAARARNPAIVYCSISGYGQNGPWRDRAGHDVNYLAVTGVLDQLGAAGAPPSPGNYQIADVVGGAQAAASALLAGLLEAARSGVGRCFDVAMTDCTMATAVVMMAEREERGAAVERGRGLLSGGVARYGVYRCADGRWFALGALEDKFWRAFCDAVGRPELRANPDQQAVRAELEALFATATRDQWAARLDAVDCCATPVLSLDEARHHPQLVARGMVAGDDPAQAPPHPVAISEFDFTPPRPPPAHGEHGAEVLREAGFDPERIATLAAQGII